MRNIKTERPRRIIPAGLCGLFFAFLIVTGCKDSGSVGGAIVGPGDALEVDTMEVTQMSTKSLVSYSGNLSYFSAGYFQDPLFGDVRATGLLKPSLPNANEDLVFDDSTTMHMRLHINKEAAYGDTLSSMQFDLVEISELWRGPAWRLNQDIALASGSPVATFTVTNQDSIDIPLSQEWAQKYATFFNDTSSVRDSLYIRQLYGLAMVPRGSGRIIAVNPRETEFIIQNLDNTADGTLSDSIGVGMGDWAYSLERSGAAPTGEATTKVYNTLEQIITFDFDFSSDNIPSINVAKAELIIYRDQLLLKETISQAGPGAVRPNPGSLYLHIVEGDELPQSIDPGSPLTQEAVGTYSEKDQAYHFDLTRYVKGRFFDNIDPSLNFYITTGTNDGVIRSNVLFNEKADVKTPKVIVTSTNNS